MKKIIFIFSLPVSILTSCSYNSPERSNGLQDTVSYFNKRINSLENKISDLETQIEWSTEKLQHSESEISYLGHKYDSCRGKFSTKK